MGIIRVCSKIFLSLKGRKILRLMNIDETKIADKLVNKVIKDNEIIEIHGIKITKNKTTRLIILTGEHEPPVMTLHRE